MRKSTQFNEIEDFILMLTEHFICRSNKNYLNNVLILDICLISKIQP